MELRIKGTEDTPHIHFRPGHILIEGRSMPENVLIFYQPIVEWVENYIKNPEPFTKIDVHLIYTNSCSIKYINDILRIFERGCDADHKMEVNWIYEAGDESVHEIGTDMSSVINIPFKYIEKEVPYQEKKRLKVKNLLTGKIGEISMRYWETIKRNGHAKDFEILEKI